MLGFLKIIEKPVHPQNGAFEQLVKFREERRLAEKAFMVKSENRNGIGELSEKTSTGVQQAVETLPPSVPVIERIPLTLIVNNTQPYIDRNTVLVIPEHLRRREPFNGEETLNIAELRDKPLLERYKFSDPLAGYTIEIQNGDTIYKINLHDRINLPGGKEGSLSDYLHSTIL